MSKLGIAKLVINSIVGMSAGYCVKEVIVNNAEPENIADAAKVTIGSVVIAGMVVEQAKLYTDNFVDELAIAVEKFKTEKDKPK